MGNWRTTRAYADADGNTITEDWDMPKSVSISFDAVMSNVEQEIDILTDDTPKEFVEKLNQGEYFTTLSYPCIAVLDLAGDTVGTITDTECGGSYDNFEMKD